MRDKLSNMIQDAVGGCAKNWADIIANHLLSDGVIVPPCKVGQTIYMPWNWKGVEGIAVLTVERISITEAGVSVRTDFYSDDYDYFSAYELGVFCFKHFGKTVFLTEEEAKKVLERSENGK